MRVDRCPCIDGFPSSEALQGVSWICQTPGNALQLWLPAALKSLRPVGQSQLLNLCVWGLTAMGAGLPKFNIVNLDDLSGFAADEVVTLEALEEKRILNPSGREARLPLKVELALSVAPKHYLAC